MNNITVATSRLILSPMNEAEMLELCANEKDKDLRAAYSEMLGNMRALPGREEWGTYWKICDKKGEKVGGLCFMGEPKDGGVEIGYGIDIEKQKNGFATEAVMGILSWAFSHENVTVISAQTETENTASRKVLEKCGFSERKRSGAGIIYERRRSMK